MPSDGSDPSMEEILASIRRILNDDEPPEAPAHSAEAAARDDDVLILDQSMMVGAAVEPKAEPESETDAPAAAQPETEPTAAIVEPEPAVLLPIEERAPQDEMSPPRAEAPPSTPPNPDLLGAAAAAATASSVGSLVRRLAAERATQVHTGGPTLEDMVRGELRPLLKDWLDQHLPPVVERLVRAEIERVVGRAVP